MSIQRRSKSASCSARPVAFTLVELLVVIAIIAVLMSLLLPSLRCAREQARSAVCGARLRDFGVGMGTYFTENNDWIPGVNTTGFELFALQGVPGGWGNPRVPVQTYDWITPILSRSTTLQASREKRYKEIINKFRCPSQVNYKAVLYAQGLAAPECIDRAEFSADPSDWTALSYLMPIHFQFWGQSFSQLVIGHNRVNPTATYTARVAPGDWEALAQTYKSRLNEVGNASRKVAAADGTRYLDDQNVLDFDPNPLPGLFGSFTSAGAWWAGDTSYGVRSGTRNWSNNSISLSFPLAQGRNMDLSYRHGCTRGAGLSGDCHNNKGAINALTFDGSVQHLSDRRSREIQWWYPKGTIVRKPQEGMINDIAVGQPVP